MLDWDSPKIRGLRKEWDTLLESYNRSVSKNQWESSEKAMRDLAKNRLSIKEMRELAASGGQPPVGADSALSFPYPLLSEMIIAFIESGDRDSLVNLFSVYFPDEVLVHFDTEAYLMRFGEKLRDPAMILGDAFSKCKDPEVSHNIARAVRRGFTGLGVSGRDDAELVKNAMQWYEKNKDRVVYNCGYENNSWRLEPEGRPASPFAADPDARRAYRECPLFAWKSPHGGKSPESEDE